MTPQLISGGRIRLNNESKDATTHFENLRQQYSDALNRLRAFVDDAIETGDFVRASENVSFSFVFPFYFYLGVS
jgi:vinculin